MVQLITGANMSKQKSDKKENKSKLTTGQKMVASAADSMAGTPGFFRAYAEYAQDKFDADIKQAVKERGYDAVHQNRAVRRARELCAYDTADGALAGHHYANDLEGKEDVELKICTIS